jgi:hypothetical protein
MSKTASPEKPQRFIVKPTFDGALAMFEAMTGKKVSPERRAELAKRYAGTPVMGAGNHRPF